MILPLPDLYVDFKTWGRKLIQSLEAQFQAITLNDPPPRKWLDLTLQNSWTGAVKYTRQHGIVYFKGSISKVSPTLPEIIGTVDDGYRPEQNTSFLVLYDLVLTGTRTVVTVKTNGDVQVEANSVLVSNTSKGMLYEVIYPIVFPT